MDFDTIRDTSCCICCESLEFQFNFPSHELLLVISDPLVQFCCDVHVQKFVLAGEAWLLNGGKK